MPLSSFDELLVKQGTDRGVKTLPVEAPDGLVLVAFRTQDEIDCEKLAAALGVDRDPITPAASIRPADLASVSRATIADLATERPR